MVNLEPNSTSVGLGDLSQQFDDILGGANTDSSNNNGDSERLNVNVVQSNQTRLIHIIGNNDVNNSNEDDRGINQNRNDVFDARGDRDSLVGRVHQEHGNSRSSNTITVQVLTGDPSISCHQQHELQENVQSSNCRTNSGLEIRVLLIVFYSNLSYNINK